MSVSHAVGTAVLYPGAPGIGRVGQSRGDEVRVDFFESPAEPIVESLWLPAGAVKRVKLSKQTRVFFQDGDRRWRAGRVLGGGPERGPGGGDRPYFVRLPNSDFDYKISEDRLHVRWEKPPRDPLQVLLTGANETARYRDVRAPVRQNLLAERAATRSASAIGSSGVQLHAHQVSAALRIIRDPVQRYLLADEVGMGKTIQAGFVMRQVLIDSPGRTIGVLVPEALVAQWRAELTYKFFLDDFPTSDKESPVKIVSHDHVEAWQSLASVDLLVIDEAHLLTRVDDPDSSPYADLARLAHTVPRVLMLSATPFSKQSTTHLALLHLLDPSLFRWDDRERFERLLESRRELALAVFGLSEPDPENLELLELEFEDVRRLLPEDETLRGLMGAVVSRMRTADQDAFHVGGQGIEAIRTHLSETYRLHHRVIRNRRHVIERQQLDDVGIVTPFEFTGRGRPSVIRLQSDEAKAGADTFLAWANACTNVTLDRGDDPAQYGALLGVAHSRVGGPIGDLVEVLRYRVRGPGNPTLSPSERAILDAAPALAAEVDILAQLEAKPIGIAIRELATAIARHAKTVDRSVVFCGRGVLASDLVSALKRVVGRPKQVMLHAAAQTEDEREAATLEWRLSGGLLVVDGSGEVGRNLQVADVVFHARTPWNPNALEQRIGRVDRYGGHQAARHFVVADDDRDGISTAWLKVLADGYEVFSTSISALQEEVDDLATENWVTLVREGIDALTDSIPTIRARLTHERKRINELDALESSFGVHDAGEAVVRDVGRYEVEVPHIERSLRNLFEGHEGYRFAAKRNADGSVSFGADPENQPLLSGRLLQRLATDPSVRSGYFDRWIFKPDRTQPADRWNLRPARRLFRRGNPFIDGAEALLALDDLGQAVAMWRLNPKWRQDPLIYFGFDFLIEGDLAPVLALLDDQSEVTPIARRRVDAVFAPQHQRVWIPVNTHDPVEEEQFAVYLGSPVRNSDVNLNPRRITALHNLIGGEDTLAVVARGCLGAATSHVRVVTDVVRASERAVEAVRTETAKLLAQSRARSAASGFVADPNSLDEDVALGRAIEQGVATPIVQVVGVSCVVVSATPWTDHV